MEVTRTFTYQNSKSKVMSPFWRDCRDQCHWEGLKRYTGGDSNHISLQLIYLACAGYR